MLHILPRVQSIASNRQQQPAVQRGSLVRFGKIAPEDAPAFFRKVEKQINQFPDLKKYGKMDFSDIYLKRLSSASQDQFETICKGVTGKEIRVMRNHGVLGAIEESSDMFFELYTLKALREKIITPEKVDRWRKSILPSGQNRKDLNFNDFLKRVGQEMNADKVAEFQKMVGWDQNKARTMLHLIAAKYILMRNRDPKYDIWQNTVRLLKDEAGELTEVLPRYSPKKLMVWLLAFAYTHLPFLPVEWFSTQLVKLVAGSLKAPVQYEDLMENVYRKQFRRQEFDYLNPQLHHNQDRKRYLKGIEIVNEAFILKNVRLWHPQGVPKA